MITNSILNVLGVVLGGLLSPLSLINITIDFVASIPIVFSFLQVVAYLLPWKNILPLIILNISLFMLRIIISLIKTIWSIIPFT